MTKPVPAAPKPREWKNREGKSITAALIEVEGEVALLRLGTGTLYRYPITSLSEESRAALTP